MKIFFLFPVIFVFLGCTTSEITEIQTNTVSPTNIMVPNNNVEESNGIIKNTTPIDVDDTCIVFDDFTDSPDFRWGIVNDGVMWGRSAGTGIIQDNTLVFSGTIVTRWGGFSSLRWNLESWILSGYNSVKLRAKSDGREYRITFRDSRWGNISHRAIIPFETVWEFEEIEIPFSNLVPAYFGRNVDTDRFDKDSAREIGVILSDGVDGDFRLEIDEVKFCR